MGGPSKKKNREVQHYVVTAHQPGGVLHTVKCNFLAKDSSDVIIAKSRRLEVRQLRNDEEDGSPFPVVFSCPIHGRVNSLVKLTLPNRETSLLFLTTDQFQYAVIGYDESSHSSSSCSSSLAAGGVRTYISGSLRDDWTVLGTLAECGPLVTVDPHMRCVVMHLYDGLVTVFPIVVGSPKILGPVFHSRLEERVVLSMTMLHHLDPSATPPHLTLLHQDSRGAQHISTHVVDLRKSQLWTVASAAGQPISSQSEWLKKSRIDGGSSHLIPVPPRAPAAAAAASAAPVPNAQGGRSNEATSGGVLILGQRQITFCAINHYKVMPIPPALLLSWDAVPPDISGMPRFLLGDEFGNLHMLTLLTKGNLVIALQLDTLGSCTLSNSLEYLDHGLVFCGSTLGDSQLVQIHDEPITVEEEDLPVPTGGETAKPTASDMDLAETTYLSVVEEYTHLGPIVDFDLVPMAGSGEQSQVVTASGSSKSGSIRVIRNGIGMKEYASVELSGIQDMWSLRKTFDDTQDTYLVQSFVGQTRVLGVTAMEDDGGDDEDAKMMIDADPSEGGDMEEDGDEEEDVGGTLEEVVLPGLESFASTLNVSNVVGNYMLQVTETQARLLNPETGEILDTFAPESPMTVATSNESGQVLVALRGGKVLYLEIEGQQIIEKASKQMDREVSCMNIHPFVPEEQSALVSMNTNARRSLKATMCAIGLWDDFTVRLLTLEAQLQEVLQIHLSTDDDEEEEEDQRRSNRNNMMARSLCLITLDFSSNSSNNNNSSKKLATAPGVDMLFVGLGDGTLISFAVVQEDARVNVQSKKEVSLGTQRINLIPLLNEKGGSCILATGDRPTVIYLTGTSTSKQYNPKLCYSNVNLSPADDSDQNDVSRPHSHESIAVNVATPFFSPLLFDSSSAGQDHYSLCVADDSNLRLGVIDDIQKLHVTTFRLGMAPRRIVHCPDGQMFAVGCIESGIKQVGMAGGEWNMPNCIRFLDDDTFEDVHRIDLEPCEMIMSMASVTMKVNKANQSGDSSQMETSDSAQDYRKYLVVGTAYALHDEDEPTKGRVMVLSCSSDDDGADANQRGVRTVAELQVRGGVYSMCQFYNGRILFSVNSKTQMCQLTETQDDSLKLEVVGVGHHGHILSLFVSSRAQKTLPTTGGLDTLGEQSVNESEAKEKPKLVEPQQLAVVGDMMRSLSLVQYYPEHDTLEEVARDFNTNWTTAVSMLNDDVYLGGENWNNLFVLRRNTKATSEEVRCRLDTVGEFHLGEMVNKFMSGSLVMPSNSESSTSANSASNRRRSLASPKKASSGKVSASPNSGSTAARSKRPVVCIGSQTLFGTVDGTLGSILGLDGQTSAFFACLERSMQMVVKPVGNFSHQRYRAFNAENRQHPSFGFIDGDMVESFLDLDKSTMDRVVAQMNRDGGWEADDSAFTSGASKEDGMADDHRPILSVDDVLAVVEEMTMLH